MVTGSVPLGPLFVDEKGSNSAGLATALSGLTANKTLCLFHAWNGTATVSSSPGAAYTTLFTLVGTSCSVRVYCIIATAATETGGSPTGATTTQGVAYDRAAIPRVWSSIAGTAANPSFPAVSFSRLDGSSVSYRAGVNTGQNIGAVTLTNYTKRDGNAVGPATNNAVVAFDRSAIISHPTADAITLAAGNNILTTIEIPSLATTYMINQSVQRAVSR